MEVYEITTVGFIVVVALFGLMGVIDDTTKLEKRNILFRGIRGFLAGSGTTLSAINAYLASDSWRLTWIGLVIVSTIITMLYINMTRSLGSKAEK